MAKQQQVECHECGDVKSIRAMYQYQVYNHPFDETPITIHVCKNATWAKKDTRYGWLQSCEELLTDHSWADFRYFTCYSCDRMICEQAPENGWHSQYRMVDDEFQICLKCYQEQLFSEGVSREQFEDGVLPGMFFDSGEVRAEGFEEVIGFDYVRVAGKQDAYRVCNKGIELIDAGHVVLVEYERMAIGGLEGYVTLWSKQKENSNE